MSPCKALHPCPSPISSASLAASAYRAQPSTSYLVYETSDTYVVIWNGMIVQPPLHYFSQPLGCFNQWTMHLIAQLRFDDLKRGAHTFAHRMSMDCEPTILPSFGTLLSEAKKIESFRTALAMPFTSFDRIATKFDFLIFTTRAILVLAINNTRFVRMQFQTAFFETPVQHTQQCSGFLQTSTMYQPIICISGPGNLRIVALHPLIKSIMHEQICQDRPNDRTLWSARTSRLQLSIFLLKGCN